MTTFLPRFYRRVVMSPIIVQGSKQKLVRWILSSIQWDGNGTYFEPFMGSGIVGFNINARKAVFGDNNIHVIRLFNDIKDGTLDIMKTRRFLFDAKMRMHRERKMPGLPDDEKFYYTTRARFNETPDSMTFLYLNLTCYKNLMRFNSSGGFNAPFFYDPGRYITNENDPSGKYIDEIVTRIMMVRRRSNKNDWTFVVSSFKDLVDAAREGDFVYADPPYIGRNVNYFDSFSREDNDYLVDWASTTTSGFAISNWYSDAKGQNPWIAGYAGHVMKTRTHRYVIENCQTLKTSDPMVKECLIVAKQNDVTIPFGLMKYVGDTA